MKESEAQAVTEAKKTAELQREIDELRRRLHAQESQAQQSQAQQVSAKRRPSGTVLAAIAIVIAVVVCAAFVVGYLPGRERQTMLAAESEAATEALPTVNVAQVSRSSSKAELVLPGNIQAVTEAPVLARASGYVKKRFVDMGDRVKAGQVLAEIDALEIGQQVKQAEATLEQVNAALEQANSNLVQGRTNERLAQTTSERYQKLIAKGAVSKQDADTYQAQFDAQHANTQSLEKAVNVARSNVHVAEANLARLKEMQGYLMVKAPFDGVITMRNVETGALVTEGNTLLFRVSQVGRLRTYVSVPQSEATSVHVGQKTTLTIPDLPNRQFEGLVTRTANSLDPTSRTLLTEVQMSNPSGELLPGMYAQVDLSMPRKDPPLLVPADTLVVRANGTQVALVRPDKTVHFQKISIGRDFGDKVEVTSGLESGQQVIVNPGDRVREGVKVEPVMEKVKKG